MNIFGEGLAWVLAPAHWVSVDSGPGIGFRVGEQLGYTALALVFVILIAVPAGLAIGHTGRGRTVAIVASNISRALPTLGLLAVLILVLGIGLLPTVIVLVILGIPPLLAGVYAGLESVNRETIDAARAIGMTEFQILVKVEIPLATALLLGGLRAATLQIVATVAVAAIFGGGGLGRFVVDGQQQADYSKMYGGAILITVLALLIDGLYALVQKFVVPRGVPRVTIRRKNTARGEVPLSVATNRAPITKG